MRYRWFFLIGALLIGGATLLGELGVGDDNSPLVFGPVLLGLGFIVSPIILGLRGGPVRPSGAARIRSVTIPLAGAALTVHGLLGAAGVVKPIAFDGPPQHCRACGTTWLLEGERNGRPRYVSGCEHCVKGDAVLRAVGEMVAEIDSRLGERSVEVGHTIPITNHSTVRLPSPKEGLYADSALEHATALRSSSAPGAFELVLTVEGGTDQAAKAQPLRFALSLGERASKRADPTVERAVTIPVQAP